MKKKFKLIGMMTILVGAVFTSCNKETGSAVQPIDPMSIEIAEEEPTLRIATSNYQTVITNELVSSSDEDYFVEGTIEYMVDNQVVSVVDFGDSENAEATLTKDGASSKVELKKKKEGSKYKKVIVKPLVKSDDCKYIVEGVIKYYEISTGAWAATIDYGNGSCDDLATKTWPAGNYGGKSWPAGSKTFSLDDWKKGGKK
jgi:hypothetical protein